MSRKIKREPALGLETAVKVFPETTKTTPLVDGAEEEDQEAAMLVDSAPVDVVGQLWSFS